MSQLRELLKDRFGIYVTDCVYLILILANQFECWCIDDASICLLKMLIWGFEFNSQKECSSMMP